MQNPPTLKNNQLVLLVIDNLFIFTLVQEYGWSSINQHACTVFIADNKITKQLYKKTVSTSPTDYFAPDNFDKEYIVNK